MAGRRRPTTNLGPCPDCSLETLTGQWYGMTQTLDPDPLTPVGELDAAMAGRRTWTLHTGVGELHPRGGWTIRTRPAGTRPGQTVHATHSCTPATERTPVP